MVAEGVRDLRGGVVFLLFWKEANARYVRAVGALTCSFEGV